MNCIFCEQDHKPCSKTECFCGDQSKPSVQRGEGFDDECFFHWEDI